MSAAESLSVGSVASLGSQDGGISQTSAALSTHHGTFGAPAAFSTTQPTVVSNANETALSAVRESSDNDESSEEQYHASAVQGDGRHEVVGMMRGDGGGGGGHDGMGMAMEGAGGYVMDSTMAAMLSSVGNEAGSTVSQAMQGESAVSERSVNKGRRRGRQHPCHAMDTRFGGRMHRGGKKPGMSTPVPRAPPQPPPQHHDTVVDHNGSLCSLVQSNSITSRNSGNGIDDEVESCSGAATSSQAPCGQTPANFSDIAAHCMMHQSSSIGSELQYRRRVQTWPLVETEEMTAMQETVPGVEGSGGNLVCEAGQTSVGLVPSDSILASQAEGSVHHHHQHQTSWAESNDGAETSPTRQGSLSVHQPQPADEEIHFGVKRKDISFDDGNSGKRRH